MKTYWQYLSGKVKKNARMSNTKTMSVLVGKKGSELNFTPSNEA